MNTILTHYVPFKSIVLSQCFVIFVATLDEILLCFFKESALAPVLLCITRSTDIRVSPPVFYCALLLPITVRYYAA